MLNTVTQGPLMTSNPLIFQDESNVIYKGPAEEAKYLTENINVALGNGSTSRKIFMVIIIHLILKLGIRKFHRISFSTQTTKYPIKYFTSEIFYTAQKIDISTIKHVLTRTEVLERSSKSNLIVPSKLALLQGFRMMFTWVWII